MLIFRYIARDLIASTVAVCSVLLLVIVSGRFVRYLADAATGNLDSGILFALIGYRLPGFVELILPLAFFLAILLAYGRMYLDNEMTVLSACGVSDLKLVLYTMLVAVGVAGIVAWVSLFAAPAGLSKSEALWDTQRARGELDSLLPRQFHALQQGRGTTYVESIDKRGEMSQVFLAQNNAGNGETQQLVVVLAESGFQKRSSLDEAGYLVLRNGYRVQGIPGQADYQITQFAEHGLRLDKPRLYKRAPKVDTLHTLELIGSDSVEHQAAFHWRMSVPFLVLVVSLLAVPLSKTNPRQGRFAKMFPAILAYVIYVVLLKAARGALEEGKMPIELGLWPVHCLFLLIGLGALSWPILKQRSSQKRNQQLLRRQET
ncbi:MAG: LPS export ABC transporter permease LptF [Porticoccaceae bacterium]|nr:LPS export ABC transporter permease LptF [Pseudomonadales bacterium]MCP5170913.1 LPS export ABC transporter permease LptF [Pseudomonadales bacterium]MCP5301847.1 LPS export ABC transporter permease LptF [Pseudomonadales bacterium]